MDMNYFSKIKLFSIVFIVLLTGCATGTRNIDLAVPEFESSRSGSGAVYINSITDNRQFEQKPKDPSTPSVDGDLASMSEDKLNTFIGRQRSGYGAALGQVALPAGGTVQEKMRDLLSKGLESRGYTVSDNPDSEIKLDISIEKFWAWFTPGLFAVTFEAEVDADLNASAGSGDKRTRVESYGLNKGQVGSNANWILTYDRAFNDFLNKLDEKLDELGL